MRQRKIDYIGLLMAACAIILTGTVIQREWLGGGVRRKTAEPTKPRPVDNWAAIAGAGHSIGNPSLIRVVEFSDFQCPYCRIAAGQIESLQKEFPESFQLVYRHFPLSRIHPHAKNAAIASECAAGQGKFRDFHDALFAAQDSIGAWTWEKFARESTVPDIRAFSKCLSGDVARLAVERDLAEARRLQLSGTPSFVMDSLVYTTPALLRELRVRFGAKTN